MSRIGISALFLRPGRVGGAEYMLRNLIAGFDQLADTDDQVVIYGHETNQWRTDSRRIQLFETPSRRGSNRFVTEAVTLSRNPHQLDSILLPNYFTPPWTRVPRVVTVIHDLAYRHFPENFSQRKRQWLRLALHLTLRRADQVVTISEFSKRDILLAYGSGFEPKITVIPNPISWQRFDEQLVPSTQIAQMAKERFLLSVAAHYSHKNLETLIRAFKLIRLTDPNLSLVLAGQLRRNLVGVAAASGPEELIKQLDLQRAVNVTGHLTDADLGHLYRRAELFVFPSLFEGFGMPAVEALGFGKPVLTTRCTSIPEVTLGSAFYVDDPRDYHEMAIRMQEMLNSPVRYSPSDAMVDQVRNHYAPKRIASLYRDVLVPSAPD